MKIFGIKITPLVIFFLVLGIVAIAYVNMVAFPLTSKIVELNLRHGANVERIALLDQTLAEEKKITAEIDGYKAQIALRSSMTPTQSVNAREATADILGEAARVSQVVISNYSIAAPEPVADAVARSDGSRLYKVGIDIVLRGTGSNAEDDIRTFLTVLEQRQDAAYYVDGFQVSAQPEPVGTPRTPSMSAGGAMVNMTVSLYYYGFPTYGSIDSTATTTAQ